MNTCLADCKSADVFGWWAVWPLSGCCPSEGKLWLDGRLGIELIVDWMSLAKGQEKGGQSNIQLRICENSNNKRGLQYFYVLQFIQNILKTILMLSRESLLLSTLYLIRLLRVSIRQIMEAVCWDWNKQTHLPSNPACKAQLCNSTVCLAIQYQPHTHTHTHTHSLRLPFTFVSRPRYYQGASTAHKPAVLITGTRWKKEECSWDAAFLLFPL
jgi:hypothetical protein